MFKKKVLPILLITMAVAVFCTYDGDESEFSE